MTVRAKICGLKTAGDVDAAVAGGAAFVGFVFFPPSPRAVDPADAAALAARVPVSVTRVGLVVDADDAMLDALMATVPLDMLQLHGHEDAARIAAIRARAGRPVMKAVRVDGPAALERAGDLGADWLLFDAAPPAGAGVPGGNARAFDWTLLAGRRFEAPWMLAGGLTPDNVAEAVAATGAVAVDVSSGVEARRGVKDPARIRAFLDAVSRL